MIESADKTDTLDEMQRIMTDALLQMHGLVEADEELGGEYLMRVKLFLIAVMSNTAWHPLLLKEHKNEQATSLIPETK